MPTLLLDFAGERTRHSVGHGRVLIGRGEGSAIRIDHPAVSRFHASVEIIDGVPILRDAGSRNGVAVGHALINQPHLLTDGERFTVGPAVITYYEGEPLDSPPLLHKMLAAPAPAGQLLLCRCGAKLWVPLDMLGGRGQCPRCHHELDFPKPRPAAPPPTASGAAPTTQTICSICQWTLSDGELVTCPSCGLTFHKECWIENKGCSAYGCNQVNVLEPPEAADANYVDEEHDDAVATPPVYEPPTFPWAYALLGGSVLLGLLGMIGYGVPPLLSLGASIGYLIRGKSKSNRGIVFVAIGVSLILAAAGLIISRVWWENLPVNWAWSRFL